MNEAKIQAAFHKHIWNTFPKTRYLCYHIPNEAKRTGYAYMIAMGMIPGIPDYKCDFPNSLWKSLYLEFKTETGVVSDKQKNVHTHLTKAGHRVEVVRSLKEAIDIFKDYVETSEFV